MRRWIPLFIQVGRHWKGVSSLVKADIMDNISIINRILFEDTIF